MTSTKVYWVSIDPVRCKIDVYSKINALSIEKAFLETSHLMSGEKYLGENCFNATVHFKCFGSDSCYQTTPGINMGRLGFKQPGYRSVKRIILTEDQENIEVFSKKIHGEWRSAFSESDAEIKFHEKIMKECVIDSSINNEISNITYWKPQDIIIGDLDTNVVIWEWCRGISEKHGDIFRLDDEWWVPYLYDQNKIIETQFNNGVKSTTIILPNETDERIIQFTKNNNIGYQIKNENNRKLVRSIRRRIITIQELKDKLDKINKQPLDPETLSKLLESDKFEIPHEFCCPISQMIMKYPVKTIDNQIYDKEQIEKWFIEHNTSPLTGLELTSKILEPHTLLKKQIIKFIESKNIDINKQ